SEILAGQSFLGCDSTVNINLIFNFCPCPPELHTESHNGCEGDGYSIVVQGTVYDEFNPVGIDTFIGGAFSGCDSIVTVSLTYNAPSPNGSESYVGCEGDGYSITVGTVTFDEFNPTGSATVVGSNGCDSIVNVNLIFNSCGCPPVFHTESYTGCSGDGHSILVNGVTYDEVHPVGSELFAGGSFDGCDSTVAIDLTFHPIYAFTETYSSCDPVDTGTFTIPLLTHYGCDSIITRVVTLDQIASGSASLTICNGDSTTVNGDDFYSSTGVFMDTIPGFSCDSVVTLDLTVDNPPNSSPSHALCPGDSISLDGSNYYDTSGTYVVIIPGTGCDTIVTLSLTIMPFAQGQSTMTICDGDSASINGSTYYYTQGIYADTIPGFDCDSVVLLTLNVNDVDFVDVQQFSCDAAQVGVTVNVEQNAGGCDSVVSITTILSPIGIASVDPTDADCLGENGSVAIAMGAGSAPYQFEVNGPNTSITTASSPIQPLDAGTYSLTVTDSSGCTDTETFVVGQQTLFNFEAIPDELTLLYGESFELEVVPAPSEVQWSPSTFLSCDTCAVTTTTPEYTLYYVVSGEEDGCMAYDTIYVEVIQPDLIIPTAFTPNGDGSNDEFHVIDKYIDQLIYLRVFNRWGELVFETNDLNHGWDGLFHGEEQELDSYIVHVLAILYTGRIADVTGNVLLLR
ncbi:MAG: gliding motility-associated C-terminal domain-containing protein, partial [Bacteroidetes bacterium]|nr:gliding motility-associated C-terminal domain-containing protein [Bacteroidota bacterium]